MTLLLALPIVTFPLGLAGLLRVCEKLIGERKATFADYWDGIRLFWRRLYIWNITVALLWSLCLLAFHFYGKLQPLLASMGCTLTAILLTGGSALAYVMLSPLLRTRTWKERFQQCVRLILEEPFALLKFLLVTMLVEYLLWMTTVGFLCFGLVWLVLACLLFWTDYSHLRNGETLYTEDRTWKDIFLPQIH